MADDKQIVEEGVGDIAFRHIRDDIVAGILQPGIKLKLDALKTQYGASVSTLREILNRLASEHLVVAEGQRGFEVAPATADNLREVADLRLLLESHAIRLSLQTGDLDWEGRVVAAHHKLSVVEAQLLAGEIDRTAQWVRYDFAFHNALISACGSRTLLDLHASVFDRFIRYHMLAASFRGSAVMDDHRALFELAMRRDVGGIVDKLTGHIRSGVDYVLSTGRI
ncbi:GntR family transcriptional regulator [Devosia sp. Root635]|uniref:GntR family transcriptional regulator n=1 Tax=Devosia sp. Root635 TaxID=1736575 RepID=UPI0006F5AE8A|nr:GntR family transcriptional regulator [Devosia sp. Root635]KRA50693.1 GntR family transcriptional regulator [Devosia sp. Root635]